MEVLGQAQHVSADTVAKSARSRTGAVSTQAIYNVLNDLVSVGLVHRIEPSGSPALYELSTRRHPPSPHVPGECGRSSTSPASTAWTPASCRRRSTVSQTSKADIVFWGTCRNAEQDPTDQPTDEGLLQMSTDTVTEVVGDGMPRIGDPT